MTISIYQHPAAEDLADENFARARPTGSRPVPLVNGETQTSRSETNLVAWALSGKFDENEPVSDACLKKSSCGSSDVLRYSWTRSGRRGI
jgi:hypothetical protein